MRLVSIDRSSTRPSVRDSSCAWARKLIATFTVVAPSWKRYSGQMSMVPPARSMRVGADATMDDDGTRTIISIVVSGFSRSDGSLLFLQHLNRIDGGRTPGGKGRGRRGDDGED